MYTAAGGSRYERAELAGGAGTVAGPRQSDHEYDERGAGDCRLGDSGHAQAPWRSSDSQSARYRLRVRSTAVVRNWLLGVAKQRGGGKG